MEEFPFLPKFTIYGKQVTKSSGFSYEDRENKQVLEVLKLGVVQFSWLLFLFFFFFLVPLLTT